MRLSSIPASRRLGGRENVTPLSGEHYLFLTEGPACSRLFRPALSERFGKCVAGNRQLLPIRQSFSASRLSIYIFHHCRSLLQGSQKSRTPTEILIVR